MNVFNHLDTGRKIGEAIKTAMSAYERWKGAAIKKYGSEIKGTYLTFDNTELVNSMIRTFGIEEVKESMQYWSNKYNVYIVWLFKPDGRWSIKVIMPEEGLDDEFSFPSVIISPKPDIERDVLIL